MWYITRGINKQITYLILYGLSYSLTYLTYTTFIILSKIECTQEVSRSGTLFIKKRRVINSLLMLFFLMDGSSVEYIKRTNRSLKVLKLVLFIVD